MITSEGNPQITDGQSEGTASRLREAGLDLFAERGFDGVRVGDIEERAGLIPRRGAMYRHFKSKAALLEAAVEHHLESVAAAHRQFSAASDPGVEGALELGLWILQEMSRQRSITRVLERDGERLPEFRARFLTQVSDAGYAAMAEILHAWLRRDGSDLGRAPGADAEASESALAVLLLGSLVNLRRSRWTFGASPLGVTDDAAVRAWAELCARSVGT